MRSLRLSLAICAFVWLGGCASSGSHFDEVSLPTDAEVTAHVTAHWADYQRRTSVFADRAGQPSDLVSVGEVECSREYGVPTCLFTVVAKFPDGFLFDGQLGSQFDRDENGLFETIVLIHERVR